MPPGDLLPVHGFVLAGGRSSRMGRDKALLPFRGRPMVEIAVEKLRTFCAEVAISGNRDDLRSFAPVVPETLADAGPVAGIETGLGACEQPWALFVPVDVPLIPALLLRRWAEGTLQHAAEGCSLSTLLAGEREQPAFCMMRRSASPAVRAAVSDGERKVRRLLGVVEHAEPGAWMWMCDAEEVGRDLLSPDSPDLQVANWFRNVNTPEEHFDAEVGMGPE